MRVAVAGLAAEEGSAAQILAEARAVVEPAHRAAVDELPPEIRHVAGYHIGWWEADGRVSGAAGKAVRPALVLACARASGAGHQRAPLRAAVSAAVAVELVHDFSLLHDDVMDSDLTRRHRATAWSVLGIWGDPRMTGKPAGNDLAARKKSLPVVAALTSAAGRAVSWRSSTKVTTRSMKPPSLTLLSWLSAPEAGHGRWRRPVGAPERPVLLSPRAARSRRPRLTCLRWPI